jgi:hypothetical protein
MKSGRGRPHSKTLARESTGSGIPKVLECGFLVPLSTELTHDCRYKRPALLSATPPA